MNTETHQIELSKILDKLYQTEMTLKEFEGLHAYQPFHINISMGHTAIALAEAWQASLNDNEKLFREKLEAVNAICDTSLAEARNKLRDYYVNQLIEIREEFPAHLINKVGQDSRYFDRLIDLYRNPKTQLFAERGEVRDSIRFSMDWLISANEEIQLIRNHLDTLKAREARTGFLIRYVTVIAGAVTLFSTIISLMVSNYG